MQGSFQHRWPKLLLLCALLLLPLLAGCARLRPTPAPLRTLSLAGSGTAKTLVVLLPGRFDSPEDFRQAGFPQIAARAGADVDIVAVDAHIAYYFKRIIVDRLREDVIGPARKRYDRIWLAGVSLGGTGSLLYATEHPDDVDGIFLIAPFLGEAEVVREVQEAGGMAGWKAPEPLDPKDFQRRMWVWLKRYEGRKEGRVPLYLGYGTQDSFALPNGVLAQELPAERVFRVEGGHDWKAWAALWEQFVQTGALAGR